MNICRAIVGSAEFRLVSMPDGFRRNHYLLARSAKAPDITAIRYVGQNEGQARRRYDQAIEEAALEVLLQ